MVRQAGVLVTGALLTLAVPLSAQDGSLNSAAWMAGCWEAASGNRVTLEMWMPPTADVMIGGSRTSVGGIVREFEHLRLRERDGALIYTAIPSGQRETDFMSVAVTDTLLVFENLQHDFPQRIAYHRRDADSIVARVEGQAADGTTRGFSIPMRRTTCTMQGYGGGQSGPRTLLPR